MRVVIVSLVNCCIAILSVWVCAVTKNVVSYSITSLLLFSHLEFKGFVLGPNMSAVSSNVGG